MWLPTATNPGADVTVYAVLDPTAPDYIGIGVGARLNTTAPAQSHTSVHVPIFRAAKAGHTVPDPILIGQSAAATIRLDTEITLGSAPPLGGIGTSITLPTHAGPAAHVALSAQHLHLPRADHTAH